MVGLVVGVSKPSSDGGEHLRGDGLHTGDVGVPVLLADVVELNHRNAIMLADSVDGGRIVFVEVAVADEVEARVGVAVEHVTEQEGQSRSEVELVGHADVVVLVVAERRMCPGIVGAAEDEDDVGRA